MPVSSKPMLTLRDIEETVQEDLASIRGDLQGEGYTDELATIEESKIALLVAIKQARALEFIASNLRDIRDTLQGKTYKG